VSCRVETLHYSLHTARCTTVTNINITRQQANMDALTDEELEAVLANRRQELVKKRQLQENVAKSEKRLKLMRELDEINGELTEPAPSHPTETSSSTEISSSISNSSA
jgi:mannosyltransferase OCH1-like enzyme